MGDYVDRGIHGFEIATYLILLKLVHPTHFTVLRGNHEVAWMNRSFFLEECRLKFGRQVGQHVWRLLNAAFCQLPYAALINGAVFVVHGGIPKNLRSLADLDQEIPKGLIDEHYNRIALQLLWNDFRTADYDRRRLFVAGDVEQMEATAKEVNGLPNDGTLKTNGQGTEEEDEASIERYFVPNSVRNIGFIAGHKAVRHFLRRHGLSYIVRAHQYDGTVKATGYNTHSAKKVLTVFSNSAYVGQLNSTACVCVNSATHSIDIIGLRSGRRNPRREVGGRNHSEIFECDELAEMKFGF
ncbi:PREDICTED: serine/threonine-protein phosphatase 2B catalytic subunit A2-like [Rhagoletis zephyria]|uniref:serine/threonine-protein phosphatase 2B catalytic subunit A2-like n=1 Tax=Rhagoletis zephyria TaxID=28612 RepID=UPI000811795C|nr:PREDICTED: serine/threonine-protein phosphatase 2B catalytic subunit A2-like [Rhagoletis zephyria]